VTRTNRLFAIVVELQRKKIVRAEDLARTFEVSKRTIYRDIEALSMQGVALMAMPGQGYSLMEGVVLPTLHFTADEAMSLLLGADLVAQTVDTQMQAGASSAIAKIEAVLPEKMRDETRYLRESLRFVGPEMLDQPRVAEMVRQIRNAIVERRAIRFTYRARYSSSPDEPVRERVVDPYSLVNQAGVWYLVGYDHDRRDTRNFRLERAWDLQLTDTRYQRPKHVQAQLEESAADDRPLEIKALFDASVVPWVRESKYFYIDAEQAGFEGDMLVTLRAGREDEVLQWLLSWGSNVRVLEPESVRLRLFEEAQAMAARHQPRGEDDA
jgi:predicted DNA-binding transcriptional regulator YafY